MRPQYFNTPAFSSLVNDAMNELKIPGIAIAVIDGDDILIQVAYA